MERKVTPMKKKAKRMSIILALALIFTSLEFAGVFALPENSSDGEAVSAQAVETEGVLTAAEETPEPTAPAAAPALTAEASYEAVVLKWTAVEGATAYVVTGNGKTIETAELTATVKKLDPFKKYEFTVAAKNAAGTGPAATVKKAPVRDIQYKLTIKQSGTLRSHAGKRASMKVKAGKTYSAYGFAGGKYIMKGNNGKSTFYVARTRVGNKKAVTSSKIKYTRAEAENYVNARKQSSKSKKLIWVNTYTQHLYLFEGKKGAWKCVDDWKISTGTASTPTPTSISGLKKITGHTKLRHGIKWWSFFHGTAALHGVKNNWGKKLGRVASNGCIRNPVPKAKILYGTKKGTKVIIY